MKVAFLSNLQSIHTVRWVNVFAEHGHEVHAISIKKPTELLHKNVQTHFLPLDPPLGYYLNVYHLKKTLKMIDPEILNAHYASGFGTLARLSGFHPLILSVWGSDVYDFPYESKIKMNIIQKNLDAADVICSTSEVMKKQTEKLLKQHKEIFVTPFGIDTNKFTPKADFSDKVKVIGTVKTLAPKYGISTLIKSFALLLDKVSPDEELKLVIVGDGPQRKELEQLVKDLNIEERCEFLGRIPHDKVTEILHSFDIYAALSESESESFGVAILEASACGLPVVVSDAGGLPEVVEDGVTGIVVPRNDPESAMNAIFALFINRNLRKQMSTAGINRVNSFYNWNNSYDYLVSIFKNAVRLKKRND